MLPVSSKVFENKTRLINFINKHHIINETQHGLQKIKTSEQALSHVKNRTLFNIENKFYSIVLFTYLKKKGFDCVNHFVLLMKLSDYGICAIALDLLKTCLSCQKQWVKIGDVISPTATMKQAGTQRSILGPLLFILYINHLFDIPNSLKLVMYTDDMDILFSVDTFCRLQKMINEYPTRRLASGK